MKFLLPILLILISCNPKIESDESALQVAIKDYYNRDFTSCQTKLLAYTQKYPNDFKGWSFLGTVASELENDSLATAVYEKSLALNPKDFKAITGLGVLARRNKEYDKAAAHYEKAILIDPGYGKAYSSLGIIELKRGNLNKAVALGEKAAALDPVDLAIKSNLTLAYHLTHDIARRDSLFRELSAKGYPYISNLELLFEGSLSVDDFL